MKYNCLKLAVMEMILILVPEKFRVIGFIIIVIYWLYNVEKKYWIVILLVLLPFVTDEIKPDNDSIEGRVRDIRGSSFVINNTVVYGSDMDINYDDIVVVESSDIREFTPHISEYSFDFGRYYKSVNVNYYCFADKVTVIGKSSSFRGKLLKYINDIENQDIRSFYRMIIFNITDDDSNFIIVHGLYFSGIFWCINYLLKWFIDYRKIKYIDVINTLLLALFYHFPLALLRLLIKKTLFLSDINAKDRLGILIIILLNLNINYIYSLGFIYPVSFYFIAVFHKEDKILFYLNSMVLQSFYFFEFNVIQVFVYKYLMRLNGFVYIVAIILMPFYRQSGFLFRLMKITDRLLINNLNVYGKPGIIVFIVLYLVYRNTEKYRYYYITVIYVLLMILNISHIYSSVSFINVEQGDSILIRLPYNQANILIDTGKESKYYCLDSYLKANGVHTLDYLIITHDDSDHNGNVENLLNDYLVKNLITEKDMDIEIKGLKLISLNNHEYDNDNDNSLVYYFELNDISFLMTGDISKKVERNIIREYPELTADVLKLSHHGSKTGSDEEFLKQLDPEIGIISSGETYNHPHQETINNLNNNHIVYFMTKKDGDIEFIFTKIFNIIKLWKKDFVIIDNRW